MRGTKVSIHPNIIFVYDILAICPGKIALLKIFLSIIGVMGVDFQEQSATGWLILQISILGRNAPPARKINYQTSYPAHLSLTFQDAWFSGSRGFPIPS